MDDLVKRLRTWSGMGIAQRGSTVLTEAADEIERLRAALKEMIFAYNEDTPAVRQARAALGEPKP